MPVSPHLARYFIYRRLYVDAVLALAPRRAALAVASEVARLGFVVFGCTLCAVIFWFLTAGAVARAGVLTVWPVVFGLAATAATILAGFAGAGIVSALRDLGRVRRAARS